MKAILDKVADRLLSVLGLGLDFSVDLQESFFDALCRVRSKRFQVLPNIGFASQLQRLEHELQPQSVNSVPSSLAQYLHRVCNAPVEIDVLQAALERHRYDALTSLRMIFGDDIPRVIQGVRA